MSVDRVRKVFVSPSRTQQSHRDIVDVNNIVKRFRDVNGVNMMDAIKTAQGGQYGDFSEVLDYRSAIEAVRAADDAFAVLPAKLRFEFGNDPAQFLDFCSDPQNLDRMYDLGLAIRPVEVVDKSPDEG